MCYLLVSFFCRPKNLWVQCSHLYFPMESPLLTRILNFLRILHKNCKNFCTLFSLLDLHNSFFQNLAYFHLSLRPRGRWGLPLSITILEYVLFGMVNGINGLLWWMSFIWLFLLQLFESGGHMNSNGISISPYLKKHVYFMKGLCTYVLFGIKQYFSKGYVTCYKWLSIRWEPWHIYVNMLYVWFAWHLEWKH